MIQANFKQDDKGRTIFYPSVFREGYIINSKDKKDEIILFYKKLSVVFIFLILALLLGCFFFIFIVDLPPANIIIVFLAAFASSLHETQIKKITEGLEKTDKLKVTDLPNRIALSINPLTLFLLLVIELFLISLGMISIIINIISKQLQPEFFIGIIFIAVFGSLFWYTVKIILLKYKKQN